MIDKSKFIRDCSAVRNLSPIIHNITNYVAMNFTANALLAIGASPIISCSSEETDEIVSKSGALVINIGCLDAHQIKTMYKASEAATKYRKPWVLDPVGAGMTQLRSHTSHGLIHHQCPSIIRCNASEVLALARIKSETKGVDSDTISDDVVEVAKAYAAKKKCIVSVSGTTDYITDGVRIESIANGSPLMPRVTAMGCAASAITAAFAAVDDDCFSAALNAMALMGVIGEMAAAKSSGPGSIQLIFLDTLHSYSPEEVAERIRQ